MFPTRDRRSFLLALLLAVATLAPAPRAAAQHVRPMEPVREAPRGRPEERPEEPSEASRRGRSVSRGELTAPRRRGLSTQPVDMARRLVQEGKLEQAEQVLRAPSVDRHDPQVLFLLALVELDRPAPAAKGAAPAVTAAPAPLPEGADFLGEVNARLASSTPEQRLALDREARWIEAREWDRANPSTTRRFENEGPVTDARLRYATTRRLTGTRLGSARELPEDAAIYVQDGAGLDGMDWSPQARRATLAPILSGSFVALRLPQGDVLSAFSPAVVVETPPGGAALTYRLMSQKPPRDPAYRARGRGPACDTRDVRSGRCGPVVIVRKRTTAPR